ncbi:ATP-binding cassette domain-containing protein [Winogradskya humida]|uniref:NHLP family bacteriocin export ABC transporter permease/ATPase subunit n=1 Tax=Winogradskya humida TaxID=113566 RepID=A0ABQ3ZX85_9ACTN|nr:ATP-binding cassette domain-containing protein [Actinoplanes humidus]GIE23163.1 NHLP family bacteriocin export ABC transporter permease/ATPase subunit [Actinoplanes humidus]
MLERDWDRLFGHGEAEQGRSVALGGVHPAFLVDGPADLFAVRESVAGAPSRRHFVARLPRYSLVPSGEPAGPWRLILVPLPGTSVRHLTRERLELAERSAAAPETVTAARALAAAVDLMLLTVADAVRDGSNPRGAKTLVPGGSVTLAAGEALTTNNEIRWVRPDGGRLVHNGGTAGTIGDGELVPLAGRDWVVAQSPCTVLDRSTWQLLVAGDLLPALDAHVRRLLGVVEDRVERLAIRFVGGIGERKRENAASLRGAARTALRVVGGGADVPDDDHEYRFARYRRVADILEIVTGADDPDDDSAVTVVEPADRRHPPTDDRQALEAVARSSALHVRPVKLPGQWWRHDLGPLVGWRDGTAVALRFRSGRYHEIDSRMRTAAPITAAAAAAFEPSAGQVQAPLPRRASMRDALRLGLGGGARDLRALLAVGLVAATLGLATPIVVGRVLASVSEAGTGTGFLGLAALLVSAAVVAGLVGITQGLRLLRLEGRAEIGTQLVLWDRLMRLPVRFFRSTSSGELANAVLGISFVRQSLSGLLAQAVTASLTVVAELSYIFWVSAPLGLGCLTVLVVAVLLVWVFGGLVVRRQRRALPAEHRSAALTNQLLAGITKIKLARAEDRAFSRWAQSHALARADLNRVRNVQSILIAVATVLPLAGQLALFAMLEGPLAGQITPERFYSVNVAYTLLLGAVLVVVAGSVEVLAAVPRLEVLAPVLEADPERLPDRVDPGDLRGEIHINDVTFSYQPDDPPVLNGVSLLVRPGEFVAVVGPSGCGKSTMLRLLLGFEQPTSGAVLYDGQDLAELDVQAVRRQCGVVLQDGMLFAGSLRENIAGAGNYPLERLWEAARMAGLDGDIAGFPMGMGTNVPFGGGTLSVGQRQRVLIARALVDRPRMLFFDEATSALDNRTQEIVTRSTRALAASRIVIAHRLSTVMNADRIVVMDRGVVVQDGTYPELMADRDGLFHRLARRQLLVAPEHTPDGAELPRPAEHGV